MKTSTFQMILLIVFGSIGVAAVLIFALVMSGGGGTSVGPVTIWGTLDQAAFTAVIRKAADVDNSLAHIQYVQKDPTTYDAEITNALANGQGPDLFLMRQDHAMLDVGKVIPFPASAITAQQFQTTFTDAANPYITGAGVLGLPILLDPLVLYWNKDMLATAGIPSPPVTWDQVPGMAQRITQKTDTGTIKKAAIAFGEYSNIEPAKEILSALIMQAGGSITTKDVAGHVVPALSSKAVSASQALASQNALQFYTEFADPSKTNYSWNASLPNARDAFASADVALYVGRASDAPYISKTNPNLNFSIAALPQIKGSPASVNTGYVYAFAIARTSKNPGGAANAAYVLASADYDALLSLATGLPGARRDVLALPSEDAGVILNRQALIMRSWSDPDPVKTADIFRTMIDDTVSGAQQVSSAVSRADQAMAQLLGL